MSLTSDRCNFRRIFFLVGWLVVRLLGNCFECQEYGITKSSALAPGKSEKEYKNSSASPEV